MWRIEWDEQAVEEAKKLDRIALKRIIRYLEERIAPSKNPRDFGKPLRGEKLGVWRYRVGDYRILCHIEDEKVTVLIISVGHRKNVYG
jgi:mRNA interferase RelE/StbE